MIGEIARVSQGSVHCTARGRYDAKISKEMTAHTAIAITATTNCRVTPYSNREGLFSLVSPTLVEWGAPARSDGGSKWDLDSTQKHSGNTCVPDEIVIVSKEKQDSHVAGLYKRREATCEHLWDYIDGYCFPRRDSVAL